VRPALAALALLAAGCSFQTYAVPQPWFHTKEADSAFTRAVQSVAENCGGVESENPEAGVVVGKWQLWNAADGVSISQCIVTVFPKEADVRIMFSVRKCPLSDMSDVEALVPTCERTDVVTQLVSTSLTMISQRLEADIRR
jgi:hypothetical protein